MISFGRPVYWTGRTVVLSKSMRVVDEETRNQVCPIADITWYEYGQTNE